MSIKPYSARPFKIGDIVEIVGKTYCITTEGTQGRIIGVGVATCPVVEMLVTKLPQPCKPGLVMSSVWWIGEIDLKLVQATVTTKPPNGTAHTNGSSTTKQGPSCEGSNGCIKCDKYRDIFKVCQSCGNRLDGGGITL